MNLAQSPHIPAPGAKPGTRDLPWLITFSLRGLWELVRARLIFARLKAKAIPARNVRARANANPATAIPHANLARIAYVMPRLSDRLPWRSDCLVQAIAAQNWLSSLGAASEIQIGVENPEDGDFAAHAWLMHDEEIVTGGDIAQYEVILSDSRFATDSAENTSNGKSD